MTCIAVNIAYVVRDRKNIFLALWCGQHDNRRLFDWIQSLEGINQALNI